MKSIQDRLGACKLPSAQQKRLQNTLSYIQQEADHFLGYPCTRVFDYSVLYPFLSLPVNNVGDPFLDSNYHLNTHEYEREVIGFFAGLLRADLDNSWGYVTNGGTEGNMYGIYLARELFPQGLVYYSEATHYSVPKILRMVHARNIMIRSQPNGEMDYHDLAETIRIHRDIPPIIFANIGSTMTGAVDNLETIHGIMRDYAINAYYIHADAALSGMILPFVEHPQPFDFNAGIDSIAISGHKMIGSPIPCGLALAKKSHVERIARSVEYVSTLDTTVSGSRNAITPLFLWYAIHSRGINGFTTIVNHCLDMADYSIQCFAEIGVKAWRNRNSITVVFPRQADDVMKRWQIAVQHDIAHIITMPHVTQRHIDQLISDLCTERQRQQAECV